MVIKRLILVVGHGITMLRSFRVHVPIYNFYIFLILFDVYSLLFLRTKWKGLIYIFKFLKVIQFNVKRNVEIQEYIIFIYLFNTIKYINYFSSTY